VDLRTSCVVGSPFVVLGGSRIDLGRRDLRVGLRLLTLRDQPDVGRQRLGLGLGEEARQDQHHHARRHQAAEEAGEVAPANPRATHPAWTSPGQGGMPPAIVIRRR
jgi:hypothetical protein